MEKLKLGFQLLLDAKTVFQNNWRPLLIISTLEQFLSQIIEYTNIQERLFSINPFPLNILTGVIWLFIYIVMFSFFSLLSLETLLQKNQGKEFSLSDMLNATLDKIIGYLKAQILSLLIILGYTLLLIIPGIIKFIKLSLISPIVVFDPSFKNGGMPVLKRSQELIKSHEWEVFFAFAIMFSPFLLLILSEIFHLLPSPVNTFIGFVGGILYMAYLNCFIANLYLKLKPK